MFIKEDVNKVNTPTWVRLNEDSRKLQYRQMFMEQFGGKFIPYGRMTIWQPQQDYSDKLDKYVIQTPENKIEITEVFSKYCRENSLNKAAMYGTLRGDRKQHKGYKLLKTPE
tara:strand:+ start:2084 stop:2419 length:336 start_codon:yes stop_codon:yes gene_type:complete